ncbi:hypothetical protein VFPFJ_08347 [Purpureocillium lilacinum]|uniref:Uncharacterized protein n=1 Tax=Purpureocillium lilacinum TaxID=33203 RepID=A0A179H8D7_PURLI|nr:hypothetical protein VFPFJ_08347 [Purpureocillium lilacinum]OAQ85958.1 hypothetical protein VFPFJ_08347 [Purpureocillium lilacinum]
MVALWDRVAVVRVRGCDRSALRQRSINASYLKNTTRHQCKLPEEHHQPAVSTTLQSRMTSNCLVAFTTGVGVHVLNPLVEGLPQPPLVFRLILHSRPPARACIAVKVLAEMLTLALNRSKLIENLGLRMRHDIPVHLTFADEI